MPKGSPRRPFFALPSLLSPTLACLFQWSLGHLPVSRQTQQERAQEKRERPTRQTSQERSQAKPKLRQKNTNRKNINNSSSPNLSIFANLFTPTSATFHLLTAINKQPRDIASDSNFHRLLCDASLIPTRAWWRLCAAPFLPTTVLDW